MATSANSAYHPSTVKSAPYQARKTHLRCQLWCRRQGFSDCRGAGIPLCRACCNGACRPLRLAAVTVQGMSQNPGRGARMPPGLKDGFPDGRDAGRVHGDPGRSGGRGTDASPDHPAGPAPGTSRWGSPVRSRPPGRRRCGRPALPHPNPAVTLSDMGGRGERSPSRRSAWLVVADRIPNGRARVG